MLLLIVSAIVSFVSLVVSLMAFRRYYNVVGWVTLSIFAVTLVITMVVMWQIMS